jgi:hypothetical protein
LARRCKRGLAAGIAAAHCNAFCASADTFAALLQ